VGGLVLPHNLGADPAALGHGQACLAGPCPHGGAIHPQRSWSARAPPPATAADSPARRDERGKRTAQPGPVRLREVDLIDDTVEAEADGLGAREPSRSSMITTETVLAMSPILRCNHGRAQRDAPGKGRQATKVPEG